MLSPEPITIRPLDHACDQEINLVAERMRETLAEVIGDEGYHLYSMEWLRNRVRWHLEGGLCIGRVLVAVDPAGTIIGHIIARVEEASTETPLGLVSTIFVSPAFRRRGVARALLDAGEDWLVTQCVTSLATDTSETNRPLIVLFEQRGYAVTFRSAEKRMVRLSRTI